MIFLCSEYSKGEFSVVLTPFPKEKLSCMICVTAS